MKIRKIFLGLLALTMSESLFAQTLDVDKQLQYCHKQIGRALAELRLKDGSYDYTMEPRNILKDDKQKGEEYKQLAIQMLAQLSTPKYQSGKKNVAFLMHSVGHHPAGSEIDASIIYADYYYLEALVRAKNLGL